MKNYRIILGSASPRRKELLACMGFDFEVKILQTEEIYPADLSQTGIAEYLACLKANAFLPNMLKNDLVICSDTTVICDNQLLGKPQDYQDAKRMLQLLSGKTHQVITGVCVQSIDQKWSFDVTTDVTFKVLTAAEIDYYIANFQPFDKAGAYGIQEWIGYTAVTNISGSYTSVMGLPTSQLYTLLKQIVM
jgi:septum formation protein